MDASLNCPETANLLAIRRTAAGLGMNHEPERKGRHIMAIGICLMKLTEEGIKNLKDAPKRVAEAKKAVEALGGKWIGFYLTMGEYDYVAIAEFPSDEVAMTYLMSLGSDGNVRTTTLKAFTLEEFQKLVEKLP
jgi:uncharacterized protein with GYD domain